MMNQHFHISGMTCNGCRSDVEQRLNAVKSINSATVSLEKEEAIIQSNSIVDIKELQTALPSKYHVKAIEQRNVFDHVSDKVQENQLSKFQQLKPLFLILGYITIATILLNYSRENWDGAMLDFMGLFLIVFSFFKMLDLKGFPGSFKMYDPLAKAIPVYGWVYPFIETALGLMFLMRFEIRIALMVTIAILSITTIGVVKTLLSKKSIQCACLGTALKLPMTEATIIENGIMIVMAVTYLFSM